MHWGEINARKGSVENEGQVPCGVLTHPPRLKERLKGEFYQRKGKVLTDTVEKRFGKTGAMAKKPWLRKRGQRVRKRRGGVSNGENRIK